MCGSNEQKGSENKFDVNFNFLIVSEWPVGESHFNSQPQARNRVLMSISRKEKYIFISNLSMLGSMLHTATS